MIFVILLESMIVAEMIVAIISVLIDFYHSVDAKQSSNPNGKLVFDEMYPPKGVNFSCYSVAVASCVAQMVVRQP